MSLKYHGACWKFGDDISCDADLMPKQFSVRRETRPEILKDHVMEGIDPDFPQRVSPGDILVGGRRFGQGNPHIQGFLGIAGLGLGLVVETIPRGAFRNAVNAGLPVLPHCTNVRALCETGDILSVDFESGEFVNETRGSRAQFEPLDPVLLETVRLGGWDAMVRKRLARLTDAGRTT